MGSKKDFNYYQKLMQQKWDAEDTTKNNNHRIWELRNDNLKQSHKLRMVEDQLRVFFNRKIIKFKEDDENGNTRR